MPYPDVGIIEAGQTAVHALARSLRMAGDLKQRPVSAGQMSA
ncbi:hypothetical protein ACYCUO_25790 [Paenibacillus sp. SEL2]